MTERRHLCYYEGLGDEWEAISVDFDIAVCGRSLDEVKALLKSAIRTYIEDANNEEEGARKRLLSRRMPKTVQFVWVLKILGQQVRQQLHLEKRSAAEGRFECPA
jgi:hypothetical protein